MKQLSIQNKLDEFLESLEQKLNLPVDDFTIQDLEPQLKTLIYQAVKECVPEKKYVNPKSTEPDFYASDEGWNDCRNTTLNNAKTKFKQSKKGIGERQWEQLAVYGQAGTSI